MRLIKNQSKSALYEDSPHFISLRGDGISSKAFVTSADPAKGRISSVKARFQERV
jgi:hypothetical protein